jgi:fumarate hydratase class II
VQALRDALQARSEDFADIVKIGRTHLQDAVPLTLGQEFSGYVSQLDDDLERLELVLPGLLELAIGGTGVGTGINTHPEFAEKVCAALSETSGLTFAETSNHPAAQAGKDVFVSAHGHLKTIAVALSKIANDIRHLGSGPRCGIHELVLPAIQPGSSIMPGKVNPVICESVHMVSAQVIGYDTAITLGGLGGFLELNVMMPLIAYNLLEQIRLLANVSRIFAEKCIQGITANEQRARDLLELNLSSCTALAPKIGYDKAAALSKEAFASGRTLREVALEQKVLPAKELDELLDYGKMTEPDQ